MPQSKIQISTVRHLFQDILFCSLFVCCPQTSFFPVHKLTMPYLLKSFIEFLILRNIKHSVLDVLLHICLFISLVSIPVLAT